MPLVAIAAGEAGTVMNVNGAVTAKGADGTLKVLAPKATVFSGDNLFTGKESYARIKFIDGAEIILRSNSNFKVENYNFDEKEPAKDSAGFNLLKGSLRALSGSIGKRGDPDSYGIKTPTATAGIRGTAFGLLFCKGDCSEVPTPTGTPPEDGLHVDVEQGTVILKNGGGSLLLNAGQYGYVKDNNVVPATVPPEKAVPITLPPHVSAQHAQSVKQEQKEKAATSTKQEQKAAPSGDGVEVTPETSGSGKECPAR